MRRDTQDLNGPSFWLGFVILVLVGVLFRTVHLEQRVLHNDEANQMVRAGLLLDGAGYHYDPKDHHGPTLYYLSLPLAWLSGGSLPATTESTFRLLPALFGIGLMLLLLLFREGLGRSATLAGLGLLAVSPGMVYYSRFYIQEMLLVFFTAAVILCGWLYTRRPSVGRAIAVGVFLGLMHATKETCIIAWGAMAAALLPLLISKLRDTQAAERARHLRYIGWAIVVAGFVSALFFSSLFTHPIGIIHSYTAYLNYFQQGVGVNTDHVNPFLFYLRILIGQSEGGLFWSEWPIMLLGAIGIGMAAWGRKIPGVDLRLARFLAVYTVTLTLGYSAIPYKTPWCMLSFLHGWILLAGIGVAGLAAAIRPRFGQLLLGLLVLGALWQLGRSAERASFRYGADVRNPYAYSHTVSDFLNLIQRVKEVSSFADGKDTRIAVVTNPQDAWPMPWYLRAYPNTGYWNDLQAIPPAFSPSFYICSLEHEPAVSAHTADHYQIEYWGLRNEVILALYMRRDLWNRYLASKQAQTAP